MGTGQGGTGGIPGASLGGPLDALPARGQPPDGANRPRPEINPGQGRWLQKIWRLVWRGGGCQQGFGHRPVCLNSSLRPNRTRNPIGTECPDYPAPLPHHRGTPARRAMLPGMHIPRLAREAGLAWGCGERAHPVLSSNHLESSSAQVNRWPPPRGRGPPDHLLAARARRNPPTRGNPLICPTSPSNLERSAVSPATHTVGGPGGPPSPLPPQPRE